MSTHNVRGTASGEYECSCGARWDRDEGGRCPATVAVSELPGVALNSTLPEPKEVMSAGDERADFEAACIARGLSLRPAGRVAGSYLKEIQCAWMLWQARAALSANHSELAALKAQASGVVLPDVLAECFFHDLPDEDDWEVHDPRHMSGECKACVQAVIVSRAEWESLNQPASAGDREALIYLMERFDNEVWVCPRCSHEEPTNDMDSASYLREYLAGAQPVSAGDERAAFEAAYSGEYGTPLSVLRLLRDGDSYIEKPQHSDRLNSSWWMWKQARAALSANHSEKQAKDAPYMSDDAAMRNA